MSEIQESAARIEAKTLPATNSLDFVEKAFELYRSGVPFIVLKNGISISNYPMLKSIEEVSLSNALGWGRLQHDPSWSDEPAQIVFTSGTEGLPKAVILSHKNLASTVVRLNEMMNVDASIKEYIGVPVTYSFGLGRARATSAAGGSFYLPERFDPIEIRNFLEAGEINAISAVPSLWRIVLSNANIIGDLGNKVNWIEIGSQYMSREEKETMKSLFPNARIVQHYGLTEASRATFLDISNSSGDVLESVGSPTGNIEIRIGQDKEICIRGDNVALGILDGRGQIKALTDRDGWLHTSDSGKWENGTLWYLGRLDDQINVSGVKVGSEALERDVRELVGLSGQFAIAAIPDKLRGDGILLVTTARVAEYKDLLIAALEIGLKKHGISQTGVVRHMEVEALPTTDTGKVQRKKLSAAYMERAQPGNTEPAGHREGAGLEETGTAELTPMQAKLVDAWKSVVGDTPIMPAQNFYDVGGDSLSAVQIGLAMEGKFDSATIRATLEGRSLADVAAIEEPTGTGGQDGTAGAGDSAQDTLSDDLPEHTIKTWSVNAVRGFMVLSVLLSHWGPGVFARLSFLDPVQHFLNVFYRMGTPGFAVVFGIGLGLFLLPHYNSRPHSVEKRLNSSLLLVFSGLMLTGGVNLLLVWVNGMPIDGRTISEAFYNVLAFYILALLMARLWLKFLARRKDPVIWSFAFALVLWPTWWLAREILPPQPLDSLLEWPRLMMVAGYSVFKVSALAFSGLAVGYWLSQQKTEAASRILMFGGGFALVFVLLATYQTYGWDAFSRRGAPFFISTLGSAFYFAFALFALGVMIKTITVWQQVHGALRQVIQSLIAVGGLALPIFAFHESVIPTKDILVDVGVPGTIALLIPLTIFIVLFLYGWRKLSKMYFG